MLWVVGRDRPEEIMSPTTDDLVSVVLVNFRSIDDTLGAIQSLREVDWPVDRLEIVVVDNESGDDSVERHRGVAGLVLVVSARTTDSLVDATWVSVRSGSIVALLNNDAKPDPEWIAAAVARFEEDPAIGGCEPRARLGRASSSTTSAPL